MSKTKILSYCFNPIADENAEILVLGSMPGQESLAAGQYYANRRNAFWKIMGELLGFNPESPYETRLHKLNTSHIALWDVLKSCARIGSLDASIEADTITVNDFWGFFGAHKNIRAVFFNGTKAESTFRQHVLPTVRAFPNSYIRLPSTSPAHAALSYRQKLHAWQAALESCGLVAQNKPAQTLPGLSGGTSPKPPVLTDAHFGFLSNV